MSTVRSRRGARLLKWVAALFCALMLVALVASPGFLLRVDLSAPGTRSGPWVYSGSGSVGLIWVQGQTKNLLDCCGRLLEPTRWSCRDLEALSSSFGQRLHSMLGLPRLMDSPLRGGKLRALRIPLWPVLAVGVAITLLLWRRDARLPGPGCCKRCGYNLTGNVSGRCPECGTVISDEQEPA